MFDIAQHALGEGVPDGALTPITAAQGDGDPAAPSPADPCPGDDRPAWRQEAGELLAAMTPGTNAGRIAQILDAHVAEDAAREKLHARVQEAAKLVLIWANPFSTITHKDKENLEAALQEDADA